MTKVNPPTMEYLLLLEDSPSNGSPIIASIEEEKEVKKKKMLAKYLKSAESVLFYFIL